MTNEELSLKTKQSLAQALKQEMKHKQLSKITITELCDVCQINRKTFYYHFEDIYDLLKWTLEQEAVEVVKNFDLVVNTEEALRFVMAYADENKDIINSALDSMGHEEIQRFFYNDLFNVIYGAIEEGEYDLKIVVDPQFKNFLAAFYTEASAGILIEWVKNRMKQDKETVIKSLLSIYTVSIPAVLLENKLSN